jgi:hypothetical protein
MAFLAVSLPLAAVAGGFASSHRLNTGTVALTNAQANSSWTTVAVLVKFDAGTNGTVAVRRESQGNTFTLASCTFGTATNLVWVADREYAFGFGDVLVIESTATNGVVQVMRRTD